MKLLYEILSFLVSLLFCSKFVFSSVINFLNNYREQIANEINKLNFGIDEKRREYSKIQERVKNLSVELDDLLHTLNKQFIEKADYIEKKLQKDIDRVTIIYDAKLLQYEKNFIKNIQEECVNLVQEELKNSISAYDNEFIRSSLSKLADMNLNKYI